MRDRTRKWKFVKQEARRLAALGLTSREIAGRVEVARSTIDRWIAAGRLVRSQPVTAPIPAADMSPSEWSASVRRTFRLDATDHQLVALGELALALAQDIATPTPVRLVAAARFQSLSRQLRLVARLADLEAQPPQARATRARPTVDPRHVLRQVPARTD